MNHKTAIQLLEVYLSELCSTSLGRRKFLAAVPLLMAACATSEQTRYREGDNSGQSTELTVEDEKKMTQEVLPQMQKEYPKLQNPEMQAYINHVGRKLVAANQLEGHPYHYTFTVVDVGYVNAFALPAGTVFVTAPLIAMAENEAELAGVVGHEIGHIKARHTAERMEKAKKEQSKSWLYGVGGGIIGGALGYGAGRLLCKPNDNECLAKAAVVGAAAGAGGGLLIQKFKFMANSREDEMEADRIGFRTAYNAGYDKDHVGTFYAKLLTMEKDAKKNSVPILSSVTDALSTHPPSQERVDQMNVMASEAKKSKLSVVSTKEFDRIRKVAQGYAKKAKS